MENFSLFHHQKSISLQIPAPTNRADELGAGNQLNGNILPLQGRVSTIIRCACKDTKLGLLKHLQISGAGRGKEEFSSIIKQVELP